MTELVFFDFGGVVSELVPERRLIMLAAVSGLSKAEVHRRVWGCGLADACDAGRYSAMEMHDRICTTLGIRLPREELRRLMCLAFRVDETVLGIARSLRRRARVGLLTNNSPLLWEALSDFFPEVSEVFEPIMFSFQLGFLKPDPLVFRAVAERVKLRPEALLMVDDEATTVAAAKASGWQAIHYTSAAALQMSLRAAEFSRAAG